MRYPVSLDYFEEIIYGDAEYYAPDGHLPAMICVVLYRLKSRRIIRWWLWGKRAPSPPPILLSPKTLFVSYFLPAELVPFQVMGWPLPAYCLDLNIESRNQTNGTTPRASLTLLEATRRFEIAYLDADYKDAMQKIARSGDGQRIEAHKDALLHYCQDDVLVLPKLLNKLVPHMSLPHALLRGEYMKCKSQGQFQGLSVDVRAYRLIVENRHALRVQVGAKANRDLGFPLYDGDHRRDAVLHQIIESTGLLPQWPRTPKSNKPQINEDVLKQFKYADPRIGIVQSVGKVMSDLRAVELAIGPDGRSHDFDGAFRTITGRHNPENHKGAVMYRSRYWRNIIRPEPGRAHAYLDFSAQEFMTLAVLADDRQGIDDYQNSDVYTRFGKANGFFPKDGPEKIPGDTRNMLKTAVLSIPYGARSRSLSRTLGVSLVEAERLLVAYRTRYPRMFQYGGDAILKAIRTKRMRTRLDWRLHVQEVIAHRDAESWPQGKKPANVLTENTLRDWDIQATAGEILRLATIWTTRAGVSIVATLHDAILIEAPLDKIEEAVRLATFHMQRASEMLLYTPDKTRRYRLKVDATITRYPDRFREKGTGEWWEQLRQWILAINGEDLEANQEFMEDFMCSQNL
jgi:DNA polymerase I